MNFLQEINIFAAGPVRRQKGAHIQRTSALTYDSHERHFRLSEQQKKELAGEFLLWRRKGNLPSCEKRIEVFVAMMASGGFYRQIGHTFGLSESTVFVYTHEVSDFLLNTADQWIYLPDNEEYEALASGLVLPNGVEKEVILYIDGSIMRISRPDHANDAYYCGRSGKNCDSINAQFVTDKYGQIRHVATGFSGKTFLFKHRPI